MTFRLWRCLELAKNRQKMVMVKPQLSCWYLGQVRQTWRGGAWSGERGLDGLTSLKNTKSKYQKKTWLFYGQADQKGWPPKMAIFHLKTCCLQESCCCSILVPLSSWQHGKIDRWLNLIESRFSPLAAVQLQPWSSFVPVTADDPTQPLLVAAVQDVLHGVLQD